MYKTCQVCNKVYIAQTGQLLKNRLSSHKSDMLHNQDRCALYNHIHNTGHLFVIKNNTEILALCHNYKQRLFFKMCYITAITLNYKTDINNLSNI